jgi:hypothetical protein
LVSGVSLCEARGELLELLPRLAHRHAARQTAFDREDASVATRQQIRLQPGLNSGIHRNRDVERRLHIVVDARKAFRRDADNGEFHPAERDVFVDDRQVGRELLPPFVVIEDDDRVASWHVVFVRTQRTTEPRAHVHRIEEVAAHRHPDFSLRRLVRPIREARDREGIGDDVLEGPGPVAQVQVIRI